MADRVYRRFLSQENHDLFTTTIQPEGTVIVWKGSDAGDQNYGGNTNVGSGTLSLYGGVRSRSDVGPTGSAGVKIYPLVSLDTQTIDGVVQVPDPYPHTGSIRLFQCFNQDVAGQQPTDDLWFDDHWTVVKNLCRWYHDNYKTTFPETLPDYFTGFHIPEMFYGRQVSPGSVLITVNAFTRGQAYTTPGPVYWVDDKYGRLWQVNNPTDPWQTGTQLSGTVLYNEGIVVFSHPDPLWHDTLVRGGDVHPHVQLQFRSVNPVKSMVFTCRMGPGEVNASNNPSYYIIDETGKRWAHDWDKSTSAVTYVTAIGLYNEERQLVAVAKLAQPIRKREQDSVDIRLKLDL